MRKLKEACAESNLHKYSLDELLVTLPENNVQDWTAEVELWEGGGDKNPYFSQVDRM